jgi:deferrochelatase/peroxidase EfeB/predicted acylesterase/phospholipase RssA
MSTPPKWTIADKPKAQRLALSGCDSDFACHLVLTVTDPRAAREFVAGLLHDRSVTFGDSGRGNDNECALNIGFTWHGLQVLGVPGAVLDRLAAKSPAFREGARSRAARHLGDAGPSAPELWEQPFCDPEAALWIAVHGDDRARVESMPQVLQERHGAEGLAGWDAGPLHAQAISDDRDASGEKVRRVHFGFRDNISKPGIYGDDCSDLHAAGELLLGYRNDAKFDLWTQDVPYEVAQFLRDGSFGVLRKIEQDEARFNDFLQGQVRTLSPTHSFVDADYLKAKLCGRWPNGELVQPGAQRATRQLPGEPPPEVIQVRATEDDKYGMGCPFGAHIRRTSPRNDPLAPPRRRTLFRRGMPYGPLYDDAPNDKRGLMGVFFGASIEDQFERLITEWVEKNPMGPPNPGRAKDPLIGGHEDPEAEFLIPQPDGDPIALKGFDAPFVRTRGTLYALFPGRAGLEAIARGARAAPAREAAATGSRSAPAAPEQRGASGATADPAPSDVPSDRFCDVVMEGGVTSGIIYATAVAGLARHYRFRNIGGSSIGAFAAAMSAAAEYWRRKGSDEGFAQLEQLPDRLAQQDRQQRTQLERLFVPQTRTRRLYEIFIATLNRETPGGRVLAGLRAARQQYRRLVDAVTFTLLLLVLAPPLREVLRCASSCAEQPIALTIADIASLAFTLLFTIGVGYVGAIVAGIVWDFARGVVPNGFGLCRGWDKDASTRPADPQNPQDPKDLAGFLHAAIQLAAGRHPIDDPALTFRDLWDAPGAPAVALGYRAETDKAKRSINLEVYCTNLTHGRPYRFPAEATEDMGPLFFRVEELAHYLPLPVLLQLQATSRRYAPRSPSDPDAGPATEGVLELPVADLPIVVAVRLAMSFPLLISAVPLYAIDFEQPRGHRTLARCWMSDGGLCSNFPIHLFDAFVPMWPTFGISLEARGTVRPNEGYWLPQTESQGRADTWNRAIDDSPGALARLGSFIVSLWLAAWHWNDSTMVRMPWVRDRVVRIFLEPGEGGINIRMSAEQIMKLAKVYGAPAAQAFVAKFAYPDGPGWTEHRWVRFNALLVALRERIQNLAAAAEMDRHTQPLSRQIDDSANRPPLRTSAGPLTPEQVRELRVLLDGLKSLQRAFDDAGDHHPYVPVPRPSLRMRHPT